MLGGWIESNQCSVFATVDSVARGGLKGKVEKGENQPVRLEVCYDACSKSAAFINSPVWPFKLP